MNRELCAPPDAESAEQAVELFRGWIIDGQFRCAMFPTVWKDDLPSWGGFFADAAIHVANAIGQATGRDPESIVTEIARAFMREILAPTGVRQGEFIPKSGPAKP